MPDFTLLLNEKEEVVMLEGDTRTVLGPKDQVFEEFIRIMEADDYSERKGGISDKPKKRPHTHRKAKALTELETMVSIPEVCQKDWSEHIRNQLKSGK